MPNAQSSLDVLLVAPLMAAMFHHWCTMRDANASHLGCIGAPPVAATFHHCTMHDANASLSGLLVATPVFTMFMRAHAGVGDHDYVLFMHGA